MKYEKPTLEELDLELEGSFLVKVSPGSGNVGGDIEEGENNGDGWD